jgi:hypothetical protein
VPHVRRDLLVPHVLEGSEMSRLAELMQQMKANENMASPMPTYRCHKEVWALKIKEIVPAENPTPRFAAILVPEGHFGPFTVTGEFVSKHNPQAGGYYVVYKNGYESFSPAQAFEEGYSRV